MKTGRLSWRVREALEQGLQSGAGSAAARQRERNDALEGRSEEMEGKLRSGIEEVRAAVAGEVEALREEHARSMRHVPDGNRLEIYVDAMTPEEGKQFLASRAGQGTGRFTFEEAAAR